MDVDNKNKTYLVTKILVLVFLLISFISFLFALIFQSKQILVINFYFLTGFYWMLFAFFKILYALKFNYLFNKNQQPIPKDQKKWLFFSYIVNVKQDFEKEWNKKQIRKNKVILATLVVLLYSLLVPLGYVIFQLYTDHPSDLVHLSLMNILWIVFYTLLFIYYHIRNVFSAHVQRPKYISFKTKIFWNRYPWRND